VGLIVAKTLVDWRDSFKASEPLLKGITFAYDPAVYTLDLWPRAVLSVRVNPSPLGSFAVVPWEATEVLQIPVDSQKGVEFGDTIHALVRRMRGRNFVTDRCRIWQCLLSGEPQLALVGSAREAVLTWRGTASWELT
jgi:hypothetical protein